MYQLNMYSEKMRSNPKLLLKRQTNIANWKEKKSWPGPFEPSKKAKSEMFLFVTQDYHQRQ